MMLFTKNKLTKNKYRLIGLAIILCLFSSPAFAYIDPGMGSMWIQTMIGVFAGFWVTIKMYWKKIQSFIFGNKNDLPKDIQDKNKHEDI